MTYEGRPVELHTAPAVGANGTEIVGIRFLDVPRWEAVPGFPGMQRPVNGSVKIVEVAALREP